MKKMQKMNIESKDIIKDNIDKLISIFPEVNREGKIDFERLKLILGEDNEKDKELYELIWNGKEKAIKTAQAISEGTLRPDKVNSKNWDKTENVYIEGDNLEVLKLLQKSYFGKIKMIYIDPPYNTGKEFIYPDNYQDSIKHYKEITSQLTRSNPETNGMYHSDWLNTMYPRLLLSKNLLREDGVIFISISDEEQANLKKICDEIFGEKNFIGSIIWNSTKSVTNTALISVSHTYNFVYCKDINFFKENRDKFRFKEDGEGFENPDNDPRGPWKADPFQVGGWRPNQQYEIENPNTGEVYLPNPGCSWKNDYNRFKELIEDNRIVFGKTGEGSPLRKRFKSEALERGKVAKTLWDDIETTTNGTQLLKKIFDNKTVFDNPKPVQLITKMLELGTYEEDCIVLDFFSGSSTTAHAVMKLNSEDNGNRKFIMVQLPELISDKTEAYKAGYRNICDIARDRIKRSGDAIISQTGKKDLDVGFKLFKLDDSNIKEAPKGYENIKFELENMIDNIKPGRTNDDLLFEIIIKMGMKLTASIDEVSIGDKKIYNIDNGSLLICLEKEITEEIIKVIPKYKLESKDMKVVFKDTGFINDSQKMNAMQNLKQFGITDVRSV